MAGEDGLDSLSNIMASQGESFLIMLLTILITLALLHTLTRRRIARTVILRLVPKASTTPMVNKDRTAAHRSICSLDIRRRLHAEVIEVTTTIRRTVDSPVLDHLPSQTHLNPSEDEVGTSRIFNGLLRARPTKLNKIPVKPLNHKALPDRSNRNLPNSMLSLRMMKTCSDLPKICKLKTKASMMPPRRRAPIWRHQGGLREHPNQEKARK